MYIFARLRHTEYSVPRPLLLRTSIAKNIISLALLNKLGNPKFEDNLQSMQTRRGENFLSLGTIELFLELGAEEYRLNFLVVEKPDGVFMLGIESMGKLTTVLDCKSETAKFNQGKDIKFFYTEQEVLRSCECDAITL